ncbi:hypothetical protein B0T18DRAFT_65626 [Schizothecium vesticola]|uniref:Uncharacterized protein n=1 Tax=Schizothecium vesticola TaxID=314040 RepID=A0AA40F566_9PEZI|nr:hypothetical protein B0T18DRAFT_65626 [Schizothecium vesticola]
MSTDGEQISEAVQGLTQAINTELENWDAELTAAGHDAETRAKKLSRIVKIMKIAADPDISRFLEKTLNPALNAAQSTEQKMRVYWLIAKQAQHMEVTINASLEVAKSNPAKDQLKKPEVRDETTSEFTKDTSTGRVDAKPEHTEGGDKTTYESMKDMETSRVDAKPKNPDGEDTTNTSRKDVDVSLLDADSVVPEEETTEPTTTTTSSKRSRRKASGRKIMPASLSSVETERPVKKARGKPGKIRPQAAMAQTNVSFTTPAPVFSGSQGTLAGAGSAVSLLKALGAAESSAIPPKNHAAPTAPKPPITPPARISTGQPTGQASQPTNTMTPKPLATTDPKLPADPKLVAAAPSQAPQPLSTMTPKPLTTTDPKFPAASSTSTPAQGTVISNLMATLSGDNKQREDSDNQGPVEILPSLKGLAICTVPGSKLDNIRKHTWHCLNGALYKYTENNVDKEGIIDAASATKITEVFFLWVAGTLDRVLGLVQSRRDLKISISAMASSDRLKDTIPAAFQEALTSLGKIKRRDARTISDGVWRHIDLVLFGQAWQAIRDTLKGDNEFEKQCLMNSILGHATKDTPSMTGTWRESIKAARVKICELGRIDLADFNACRDQTHLPMAVAKYFGYGGLVFLPPLQDPGRSLGGGRSASDSYLKVIQEADSRCGGWLNKAAEELQRVIIAGLGTDNPLSLGWQPSMIEKIKNDTPLLVALRAIDDAKILPRQ